jgi:hypothetical protein
VTKKIVLSAIVVLGLCFLPAREWWKERGLFRALSECMDEECIKKVLFEMWDMHADRTFWYYDRSGALIEESRLAYERAGLVGRISVTGDLGLRAEIHAPSEEIVRATFR